MGADEAGMLGRLLAALVLGAAIGLERSIHGRPAGFRTHALVCMSTALLMLVTVNEGRWFGQLEGGHAVIDPTRMAQGIMTGIGFIGAGTIIKDGLTVSGLTTAAALWITAAIGILAGIGFWFPALAATLLTLLALSVFRRIESHLPVEYSARFSVRYERRSAPREEAVRELVRGHGIRISRLESRFDAPGAWIEFRMAVRTRQAANASALAAALEKTPGVIAYRLSPMGD